ncbi:hypothetical protein DMB65_06095 [Flavobacterium cheongpyeongense]|uniref:Uncharacterized protein n=1 Tax=Flavobacterium cheongpyeongense TaxID=2212651 RepID=A0A2V4BUI6_9FLAO|nr:hypothetical protein DMB65_06095 [Flavobacterium cheongpyeongense]
MKKSSQICETKEKQNEFNRQKYVLYDVGNFRRVRYCLVLNLKITIRPLHCGGFFLNTIKAFKIVKVKVAGYFYRNRNY